METWGNLNFLWRSVHFHIFSLDLLLSHCRAMTGLRALLSPWPYLCLKHRSLLHFTTAPHLPFVSLHYCKDPFPVLHPASASLLTLLTYLHLHHENQFWCLYQTMIQKGQISTHHIFLPITLSNLRTSPVKNYKLLIKFCKKNLIFPSSPSTTEHLISPSIDVPV